MRRIASRKTLVATALALGVLAIAGFAGLRLGPLAPQQSDAADAFIEVGDDWFCNSSFENGNCPTNINVGDTVTWTFTPSTGHTSTACNTCGNAVNPNSQLWHSGELADGEVFARTFDTAGTFTYQCNVHPDEMQGTIFVTGGGEPSATATPTEPDVPIATPTRTATRTPTLPPQDGNIGDVDCNGVVNSIDAALELQYGAGLLSSFGCPENADANEDGLINSIDAALILQFGAGLVGQLPP